MSAPSRPLVSFVIPSRNDDYMGDSNWRTRTSLMVLSRALTALGRRGEVEVLIVDWGSDIPLHRVLDLPPEAAELTRFVIVPPAVHREVSGGSPFPDPIVVNTGVRRARGTFICHMGNDLLMPKEFLAPLFDLLTGRSPLPTPAGETLMVFARKHIPREVLSPPPAVEALEEWVRRFDAELPAEPVSPFFLTRAGLAFLHRDLWHQARGYDESLLAWGMLDADLATRIRLRYHAASLTPSTGLTVYHLQHYAFAGDRPARRKRENPLPFGPFAVNGPSWGLGELLFEEHPPAGAAAPPLPPEGGRVRSDLRTHLGIIIAFMAGRGFGEGLHALVHYLRSRVRSPFLARLLGHLRLPRRLRRAPLYERTIEGPWTNQKG